MLEDEKERKKCLEVVDEARDRVEKMVSCLIELFDCARVYQQQKVEKNGGECAMRVVSERIRT